jgi:hypothetical protein
MWGIQIDEFLQASFTVMPVVECESSIINVYDDRRYVLNIIRPFS